MPNLARASSSSASVQSPSGLGVVSLSTLRLRVSSSKSMGALLSFVLGGEIVTELAAAFS